MKITKTTIAFVSFSLFVLALLPRIWGIGGYLTTDERFWVESSRDFLGGLTDREFSCPAKTEHKGQSVLAADQGLACTLRAGHPGVITMWSGSFGIWFYYLATNQGEPLSSFIEALSIKPVDQEVIPWVRLPTAILAAVTITLVFLLLNRLLQKQKKQQGFYIALISAVLMALSPFEIALSRVLHTDALETMFTTLSLLVLFNYWRQHSTRSWLFLSGALAGLAFLAKSPALFLIPYIGLIVVWYFGKQFRERETRTTHIILSLGLDVILWLVAALIVYSLFWPALWVIPSTVVSFVFEVVFGYASELDDKGNFFWGSFVYDPGPWFYPTSWLLRTTPLVIFGFLLAIVFWLKGGGITSLSEKESLWQRLGYDQATPTGQLLFLSFLFVITFTIFLSASSTKQMRYLLPIYPFLNIIATVGWAWFIEVIVHKNITANILRTRYLLLLMLLTVVVNGILLIRSYPYYFIYYNPLFGGLKVAQNLVSVGWGEGLDLAANYLNQKPDAVNLRVASWYGISSFAPFFVGDTIDYYRQKGNVLAGDYVVTYISQRQRDLPDGQLFEFLEDYAKPEATIFVAGLPYVWIYPGVGLDHSLEYERFDDLAELLGWEYTSPGVDPDYPVLKPGDTLEFDLWWEYLGKSIETPFFLWLVGPDGQIWAEAFTEPKPEAGNPKLWKRGKIVPETGNLKISTGMPPGEYTVYIGFYPTVTKNPAEALLFSLGENPRKIIIEKRLPDFGVLPPMQALDIHTESFELLGYHIPQSDLELMSPFEVELFWQTLVGIERNYKLSFILLDEMNEVRWEWEPTAPVSFYPTSKWEEREIVRSKLAFRPTLRTPGGNFQLGINIYVEDQFVQTLPLFPVSMPGRIRQFELKEDIETVDVSLGKITLRGFKLSGQEIYHPGDELFVELFWQADDILEKNYTVFVQLLGPDGKIYGQMDSQPQNGETPTSHWTPGEYIKDSYRFTISENALPGEYQLLTGMYQLETGERLITELENENFVRLMSINIR